MSDRFTQKAENALNRSVKIAEELGHTYIGTEHLLLALAEDDLSCAALILKKNNVDKDKISSFIKDYSGTGVKSSLSSKDLTPRARKILEGSYNNATEYGVGTIGTEHILLTLIEERDSVAIKLMKNMCADLTAIREDLLTLMKSRERTVRESRHEAHSPVLKQYGKNLCEIAREGKFDPVIGRDRETDRLIRVLSRKTKNNPCLIGEAGVGKTAVVEGLAEKIVKNEVPSILRDKTIISVDLTSMVAGAKYRGDFEERIKNVINEVAKHKDVILFIDEIHTIVGAGAAEGAVDAANILKPQLARGDIQIIGATTYAEYKKYIEKDAALERRFQPILINEPSECETVDMLIALKDRYEKHHGVEIDEDAIRECVSLSKKYINDRYLPDKAIDVMDEACAMATNKSNNINKSNDIFEQYMSSEDKKNQNVLDIKRICEGEYPSYNDIASRVDHPKVTVSIVRDIISEACGIPVEIIKKSVDYSELSKKLNDVILGQNEAIGKLISVIKRNDLGFGKEERPRGMFLFAGESGVGKTALATELAKCLYFHPSRLLRFDMSEYSEKQSISKLIGSPPGYVGHEEGGALTEAVRKYPNSVILFDEIERADKEILNILLQISDYGYLSDSSGRRVNFRNAIIIATTNIGASNSVTVGFESSVGANSDVCTSLLQKYYSKELINRFDAIISFLPLDKDIIKKVVQKRLEEITTSLRKKGYNLQYTEEVIENVAERAHIKKSGARAALREVECDIEDKIIDIIINTHTEATDIHVSIVDGMPCVSVKNTVNS